MQKPPDRLHIWSKPGGYFYALFRFTYTGLRITEFLTLVSSSVRFEKDVAFLTSGIKTDAGKNQIVSVHPKFLPILQHWMENKGKPFFCNLCGKPYTAKYFRVHCFKPALEEIGVRVLTSHATRHV